MSKTVIEALAAASIAAANCEASGNTQWRDTWRETVSRLMQTLPSGSGFDCGTRLLEISDKRAVFATEFHHMDANGMYDGWTEHRVTVTACFSGIDVRVSGRDRNGVKEYIGAVFYDALTADKPEGIF